MQVATQWHQHEYKTANYIKDNYTELSASWDLQREENRRMNCDNASLAQPKQQCIKLLNIE